MSVVGAHLLDVSIHGMAIESPVALEQESFHRFRLVIAGEKVDVEARVAVCRPQQAGPRRHFGIGMEFKHIPPEAQERLARVLEEIGASPPPDSGQ